MFASHLCKPKIRNKACDFPKPITSETLFSNWGFIHGFLRIPRPVPQENHSLSLLSLAQCNVGLRSAAAGSLLFFYTRPLTMSPSGSDKLKNFSEVSPGERESEERGRRRGGGCWDMSVISAAVAVVLCAANLVLYHPKKPPQHDR